MAENIKCAPWPSYSRQEANGREEGVPVAVYGAGAAGTSLLHSLNQGNEFRLVVLFDYDPALYGTTFGGVKV